MAAAAKPAKPAYELSGWERFKKDVVRDKWLYLLILPGMLFMLIFRYIPIFGNVIAFMDFNPFEDGMWLPDSDHPRFDDERDAQHAV